MRVSLHAAATQGTGWGHFFRLSALGEEMVRRGHEVFFCLDTDDQRLVARLQCLGMVCVSRDQILEAGQPSISVVDDYQPDLDFFAVLRELGTKIAQIVDSGSVIRIPDALIVRPDPLAPLDGDLSGLKFVQIGSDTANFVGASVAPIGNVVSVVVGGAGGAIEDKIYEALQGRDGVIPLRLRNLMAPDLVDRSEYLRGLSSSAVCVCGAGTTLWECCALGVPAVTVIVAENQRAQALWAHEKGLCIAADGTDVTAVIRAVDSLIGDTTRRSSMVELGRTTVDTRGPERVARFLERMVEVTLRKCSLTDVDRLFTWRSADGVNRWMLSDPPPCYESHRTWLFNQLSRNDKWMWIIEDCGNPIGLVSLERSVGSEVLELGIYVAEETVGGVGRAALATVLRLIRSEGLGSGLRADVFADNARAIGLYESMGFEKISGRIASVAKDGEVRDVARYELSLRQIC